MLCSSQSKLFCLWKRLANRESVSLVRMISLGLVVEPQLRFRLAHFRAEEKNVALAAIDAAYDDGLAIASRTSQSEGEERIVSSGLRSETLSSPDHIASNL